jgi:hypothetical protein
MFATSLMGAYRGMQAGQEIHKSVAVADSVLEYVAVFLTTAYRGMQAGGD